MEAIQTTASVTETRVKQPTTPLIMMTAARKQAIRASLEPNAAALEYKNKVKINQDQSNFLKEKNYVPHARPYFNLTFYNEID